MSQENVEIVRRAYAAFNDGDLGTVLAILDPDIEWNASDVFFDQPRTYRGRRAWQEEFLHDLMQIFEYYRGEPEELRDAGDQIVAVAQMGGTGRRSGAKAMARVAHVFTFTDGRLVRFTEFKDVGEAFEAVGLSE
jgi:ketosteroid isomerase-like protein